MKMSSNPVISAIVAMDENRVIGKDNQLPWHLPADLKHFKAITTGHPILMGRKTYESIGKALPNRTNYILTRDKNFQAPNCITVHSMDETLKLTAKHKELFIIGGAQLFTELLPYIQRIYLTIIHHHFDGDTFFPELNPKDWKEMNQETHSPDENNLYSYTFYTLEKINHT